MVMITRRMSQKRGEDYPAACAVAVSPAKGRKTAPNGYLQLVATLEEVELS